MFGVDFFGHFGDEGGDISGAFESEFGEIGSFFECFSGFIAKGNHFAFFVGDGGVEWEFAGDDNGEEEMEVGGFSVEEEVDFLEEEVVAFIGADDDEDIARFDFFAGFFPFRVVIIDDEGE